MHKNTVLTFTALAVLIALLLGGCAPQPAAPQNQPPTAAPISVTDGLGRTITLPEPAGRVVSTAPSNVEILYALGAGGQVVGRDEFTNYPAEALALPSVGGSFGNLSNEAIVNLQPDLVLMAEINTPEQVQALQDLGLPVFYLSNPSDLEGMYANLVTVGKLTGREAEANALVETLRGRVDAVEARLAGISERPKVFYELDSTDPSAPYTAGAGTFIDLLIRMAGGENVTGSINTPWVQLSIEELLVLDPEIILLGDAAYGVTVESVMQRTGWQGISAVANGQIYPINDDLISRPGPRMVDGLEELANLLHPNE